MTSLGAGPRKSDDKAAKEAAKKKFESDIKEALNNLLVEFNSCMAKAKSKADEEACKNALANRLVDAIQLAYKQYCNYLRMARKALGIVVATPRSTAFSANVRHIVQTDTLHHQVRRALSDFDKRE